MRPRMKREKIQLHRQRKRKTALSGRGDRQRQRRTALSGRGDRERKRRTALSGRGDREKEAVSYTHLTLPTTAEV